MATKILAIDDSKTMRLAIKITFAAEDAEVTSVSKGSDAVARIKAKQAQGGYDVVLVDAQLAGGEPSGYDVCAAIKQDPATAKIPVIVLVNNQTGADEGKLASAGGDDWLAKPFSTDDLIEKVSGVIAKGSRPAAAAAAAPAAAARPARAPSGPVAAPPAARAARPANRTQMGMPAPATGAPARPAVTAPAAAKAATPARAPVNKTAAKVAPPPSRAPAAAARPAVTTPAAPARPATPARPVSRPAVTPAATPSTPSGDASIPIAIPIPFTAADSPTPGMVERIKAAAGAGGVDPKVAEAIAALSREVVERIVWEVVPDLAESIIREHQAKSA